ncbi:MAG TPA: DUF4965 domain-containing protein [Planctomycetota bacterium]|nr:DUF4965 domain-containing protein [Planctomycetota bacterium]
MPLRNETFRPPAVPLVACDPFFSIWSFADKLTDAKTTHWTGSNMPLCSMLRVDGKTFRVVGADPKDVPALEQTSVQVLPTRTIYSFQGNGIELKLSFTTPALPKDLDLLSWPVTYIDWEVKFSDKKTHDVSIYFHALADIGAATCYQNLAWSRLHAGDFSVLRSGSQEQRVLEKRAQGDRIDWGYLYLASPTPAGGHVADCIAPCPKTMSSFAKDGTIPEYDDLATPRQVADGWPALVTVFEFKKVASASCTAVLAYDDIQSVELFQRRLLPYWRKQHSDMGALLRAAVSHKQEIQQRCEAFDAELLADLNATGGSKYAELCSLVYRQTLAANKIAMDFDGSPLQFPKENYSGGFISTVDVHYPASPFFLLFNPELLKAQLTPVFDYAGSGRWPYPFAPHDLGDYPIANGQTYGGTHFPIEKQMPVEECGNMLLMAAAIAKIEGNAAYSLKHWKLLQQWAEYLKEKGLDPENQLCTDDFMGHLAHNANLSIKAILGIGAFSMLCHMAGKESEAAEYHKTAQGMAREWLKLADDGTHYRLAFDKPGTWSQKYNLVWDKLLGLNLFPAEVARKEVAHYLKNQQPFGLPLDSRGPLCKNDWAVWSATLAEKREDFEAIIAPLHRFCDETESRIPLTDCYWCDRGVVRNFQARSVVGGFFIKLLADEKVWTKWARR